MDDIIPGFGNKRMEESDTETNERLVLELARMHTARSSVALGMKALWLGTNVDRDRTR